MIDMVYVDSSNIEAIGFDEAHGDLHVQFISGGYYIYHSVPLETYQDLMNAPSKGSFLNRELRGVFQFTKQ